MHYVGVDLHKEQSWFYVSDHEGKRLISKSITNSNEELKRIFDSIPKPFKLGVEATRNWYFFIDLAEQYAEEVKLANSFELKAFAKRNKKTDKIDAKLICDVLRMGYLPAVHIPPKPIREIRELIRYRISLVYERTFNINRLKNTLGKLGMECNGDLTTYKQLDKIETEGLPAIYGTVIQGHKDRIRFLTEKIRHMKMYLEETFQEDQEIINLISIPGLSYLSAAIVKSEIVDINNFASFNRLCSYAGLAPRVSQSAKKDIHGPLSKNRRKLLQWILLEVTPHFVKASPEKKSKFDELSKRKNYNIAKVALARELLRMIYVVLKEKRKYYSEKIRSTAGVALHGV
ncbi:MAG TPA: IS110 family transposase [Candidatus Goldiibacteriota bacterium]|nr:IS110 family transposase [Candidatus Goldiibacteriota bacterium]